MAGRRNISNFRFRSKCTISETLINQSLITTAIGAGTTLCLLIILMVSSFLMGWVSIKLANRTIKKREAKGPDEVDKNRAMAAVIAASILKSSQDYQQGHSN